MLSCPFHYQAKGPGRKVAAYDYQVSDINDRLMFSVNGVEVGR